MALTDLTDPNAVHSALREFDRLGREAFLGKYGFGEAREYVVLDGGKTYDSKAIVGAAHGFQFGRPLQPKEFSGGEATVQPVLRRLGFEVVRTEPSPPDQDASQPRSEWTIEAGQVVTRSEVSKAYGGSIYGGIESSARTHNVMIYTDPSAGVRNGYHFDGWDKSEAGVFYYSGEGPSGDQQMVAGNRKILDHVEEGNVLRLFEAVDGKKRTGGKLQRYVGAFSIDGAAPWKYQRGAGRDGNIRNVIVFTLRADDNRSTRPTEEDPARPHPESRTLAAGASMVPPEQNTVIEFERSPVMGARATRIEAQLVSRWEDHLKDERHACARISIKVPDEVTRLVTDTYDQTADELFEAKSSPDRATVRLGVGQLLDYLRFVPGAKGSLLLPSLPKADLIAFVHSVGFSIVYETTDGWERLTPH